MDENGLVATGGNLSSGTLLNAYTKGIFPWFNAGETIQWYSPDPRFVLYPGKIKISHSMRNVFNKHTYRFSMDKAFPRIIHKCRLVKRPQSEGTWISDEIEKAYNLLFEKGLAHSAEAWYKNELAGGLYGVLMGRVFFGESIFAHKSNASKFAFIKLVQTLQRNGIELIDCQVYTAHLQSLGAEFISRRDFNFLLATWIHPTDITRQNSER